MLLILRIEIYVLIFYSYKKRKTMKIISIFYMLAFTTNAFALNAWNSAVTEVLPSFSESPES